MDIKYFPGYQKESTMWICVHNTGGLGANSMASTQHLTPDAIEPDHKNRFGMLSSLGSYIGYNFYISKLGVIYQARAIGEETAAQRGHNYNGEAISICLAGNFTKGVDRPTFAQTEALKGLIGQIPRAKVVPHRFLQAGTDCFGSGLPDNYFSTFYTFDIDKPQPIQGVEYLKKRISLLQQLLALYQQLKATGYKLGSERKNCNELDVKG